MSKWTDFLFRFYTNLRPPVLPANNEWLHPQRNKEVQILLKAFFKKYYFDQDQRTLFLGINPGRFGAGITGVNFTAPKQLREYCNIDNPFAGSELSAEFIYMVINAYGDTEKFYKSFFIGSVCPLGLVKNGKNLNYYDDKAVLKIIEPFIVQSLSHLVSFRVNKKRCICIGGEKNFKYLFSLNEQYKWFQQIDCVPHPRFIMQYKRKFIQEYINLYLELLKRN